MSNSKTEITSDLERSHSDIRKILMRLKKMKKDSFSEFEKELEEMEQDLFGQLETLEELILWAENLPD